MIPHISWEERLGYLVLLRDERVGLKWRTEQDFDDHVKSLATHSYQKPTMLRRFRRWCREMNLTDPGSRVVKWERLNRYLKPEFQWHPPASPCRTHGAELLYAL